MPGDQSPPPRANHPAWFTPTHQVKDGTRGKIDIDGLIQAIKADMKANPDGPNKVVSTFEGARLVTSKDPEAIRSAMEQIQAETGGSRDVGCVFFRFDKNEGNGMSPSLSLPCPPR